MSNLVTVAPGNSSRGRATHSNKRTKNLTSPSAGEAEAGESLGVRGQAALHSEGGASQACTETISPKQNEICRSLRILVLCFKTGQRKKMSSWAGTGNKTIMRQTMRARLLTAVSETYRL